MNDKKGQSTKALLGIPGLDDVLLGGLRRNRLFPVFWVKRGLSLKYAMTCQSYCGN
jgi:hypothetical protein